MFCMNPVRSFEQINGRILILKFDFVERMFFVELLVDLIYGRVIEDHDVFRMRFLQMIKFMMELVVLVVRVGGVRA